MSQLCVCIGMICDYCASVVLIMWGHWGRVVLVAWVIMGYH